MTPELTNIILMAMITCAAFVGAINAKGTAKLVLSYLLAFICLAATLFAFSQQAIQRSQQKATIIANEAGKILEDRIERMEAEEKSRQEQEEMEKQRATQQAQSEAVKAYSQKISRLLRKVSGVNNQMANLKTDVETDQEYEEMLSRSNYFLGQMRKYKNTVHAIKAPSAVESKHENAVKAVDASYFCAAKLRRYFNAENAEEEQEVLRIFKSKNRHAIRLTQQVLNQL